MNTALLGEMGKKALVCYVSPAQKYIVGKKIARFLKKECGDVIIEFDNKTVLEFIVDTCKTKENNEAHRLIVMKNNKASDNIHYVFEK